MLDGKIFGFIAVGDMIMFRPLYGNDVEVLRVAEDVDSHTLAKVLNDQANGALALVRSMSEYKF